MTEEMVYRDGDIVWVKMNKLWWPGEVHGPHRLPNDFLEQFKKPPLAVVKFFQEHNYHYVNQLNQIAQFNCAKKNEFIKKGLELYYAKHQSMEEFPADVAIAEKRTGGNPNIIYSKEFLPATKPGNTKVQSSTSKGSSSRSRRGQQTQLNTPIVIPRVMIKPDHLPRILATAAASPSPTATTSDKKYKCTLCNYGTDRINTFVWHQKSHNTPKTPQSLSQNPLDSDVTKFITTANSSMNDENIDSEVADPMSVESSKKPSAKRQRQATPSKVTEKKPKTENKLKKILDDWSDDDDIEETSGRVGMKEGAAVIVIDTDEEDDVKATQDFLAKKRQKVSNANSTENRIPNPEEVVIAETTEMVEVNRQCSNDINLNKEIEMADGHKGQNKSTLIRDDESVPQPSTRHLTRKVENDDIQASIRSNLRSGRVVLNDNSNSKLQSPKRRGRSAKQISDNSSMKDTDESAESYNKSEEIETNKELSSDHQTQANDEAILREDKMVDETVASPTLDDMKITNKGLITSNSRTSRKGKPRRKEEIKLANNVSVAVLVEKTTSPPLPDKRNDQKFNESTEVEEYINIVHKKIRYMSHSSSDDHRKSIEKTKLREEGKEPENVTADQANIIVHRVEASVEDEKTKQVLETDRQVISSDNSVTTTPNSIINEHLTQKHVKTKYSPTKTLLMDQYDDAACSTTSFEYEAKNDESESPNLRQKALKSYENTRNRRKSDRRTEAESTDTSELSGTDQKVHEIDNINRKSIEVTSSSTEDVTNISGVTKSINSLDQSSEASNSKTSTPEKADTSKDLDCFDFTEDEYLKLPPQVLNRRKRLPPVKMFELDDMEKIEEQRKLDEDALRIAKQREEDNQRLHAELENLLNTTTPAKLPEIPIANKAHVNFPERRAEKDPEKISTKEDDIKDRTLPPKERKKRIFKYRNRNRQSDSDTIDSNCDVQKPISLQQPISEENIVALNVEVVEENEITKITNSDVEKIDALQQSAACEENMNVKFGEENQILEVAEPDSQENDPIAADDLQIEIAQTLINFPLLSPQIDSSEASHDQAVTKTVAAKPKESVKRPRRKLTNYSEIEPKEVQNECSVSNVTLDDEHNSKSCIQEVQKPLTDEVVNESTHTSPILQNTPNDTPTPPQLNEKMIVAATSHTTELMVTTIDTPAIHQNHVTSATEVIDPIVTSATSKSSVFSSARDFSRIRLIEKIDNHPSVQPIEEINSTKPHPLPLKKTVILTQNEGSSFITRIPKKRKSQMEDDIPAFVIERPKDLPDESSDSNSQKTVIKKEPKSFVITKTVKKQLTGELPKANVAVICGNAFVQKSVETNEKTDENVNQELSQLEGIQITTNATPIANKQTTLPSESSIASPVIMSRHIVIHNKKPPSSSNQKQSTSKRAANSTSATATQSNVLSGLSIANRPCTIAPAKKASYRKPADMTGLTQKKIGTDGKGNPVMIYTKISPIASQTPPVQSQTTFVMKRNEPIPSTSQPQIIQSFVPSPLQPNPSNQFVITSKGALITNKSFVTTTHATQHNRPNIQMQTQIIRSPNPQIVHQQSNQIIIRTNSTNLSQRTAAPVKSQSTNRRNVVHQLKESEVTMLEQPLEQPDDRLSSPSGYIHVNEENTTIKKRIVRRMSKNQSTTTPHIQLNQQQQILLNAEFNHVGNATAPVPPLIPIATDHLSSASRKHLHKPQPTQMSFVQEPQLRSEAPHIDVVEQQQENVQEILALPGDTFGGPPGSYFLCKLNELGVYIPIDHQPLYLDVTDNTNLLKPNVPEGSVVAEGVAEQQNVDVNDTEVVPQQSSTIFQLNNETERVVGGNETELAVQDNNNPKYLINISDGQQLLVDQQSLMALANGEDFPQFVTPDGHQIILQGGQHDILSAIAFAEDVGLIAGQQILIPDDDLAVIQGQSGNHDILAAALAGTEAFSQEQFIDNVLIQSTNGVEDIVDQMVYHHTIPQPTVTALTNETNAVLTQPPIMSTLEQPTKTDRLSPNNSLELMGQNLDESLAVIGVTSNTNVPTSLELPITITNPAIAPKATSMSSALFPPVVTMPPSTASDHDLEYELFSSTLPISHHLTQSLAINENYRPVNVINPIGDIDLDPNIVASTSVHQSFETNQ